MGDVTGSGDDGRRMRRFRVARVGLKTVGGFGISMAVLAVVSLIAIPSMVAASGAAAWGMVALGQSIGGIGSAVITYGWALSGPAFIARADTVGRVTEYLESLKVRMVLWVPVACIAFLVASSISGEYGLFAGFGAISMATIGLSANWVFIGGRQPFLLLIFETLPRVAGTIVGIALMSAGSSALVGVACQFLGMIAAFLVSTAGIVKPWRLRALRSYRPRPIGRVFASQRLGVASSVLSSLYVALPIVIVSFVAPAAQPTYAVVEKVQRQVIVGLGPFVTVLQGWVPRASADALNQRVRQAVLAATAFSLGLTVAMFAIAPELVRWLGNGEIRPGLVVLLLMSVITGTSLLESMIARACLVALGRLDVVSRATALGFGIGLPVVAIAGLLWGAEGALAGVLVGLAIRVTLELFAVHRATAMPDQVPGGSRLVTD